MARNRRSPRRRSSPPYGSERGFTLIELLVATAIGGLIMAIVSQLVHSTARYRDEVEARVELRQGISAAVDALTRDLRLAGSCLPTTGDFIAIEEAARGELGDRIRVRIGEFADGTCVRTALRAASASGARTLEVEDASAFGAGQQIHIRHPNGSGAYDVIDGVDTGANELTLRAGPDRDFPISSGVYAYVRREYYVGPPRGLGIAQTRGDPGFLIVSYDDPGGDARWDPFVLGIDGLAAEYRLARNCPPCDVVTVPSSRAEWRLVTDVWVTVGGAAPSRLVRDTNYRLTERFRVKPRNLLP